MVRHHKKAGRLCLCTGWGGLRALLLNHWMVVVGWGLVWSVAGFALMGMDKRKAKRGHWRTAEKTFFVVAILGGAAGTVLGMQVFRHKTKHWYFCWGLPAILLVQVGLVLWLVLV